MVERGAELVRLTGPLCAALVIHSGCGQAPDAPDVPIASFTEVTEVVNTVSGAVALTVTLSDPQRRLVNLTVTQGVGSASSPATLLNTELRGMTTSVAGQAHTFEWDTAADLGYVREEQVHVAVAVDAGGVGGIGDEMGPFTIDNTGIPRFYTVGGDICRAVAMLGTVTGDMVGKLYIGIYHDADGYPPLVQAIESLDLLNQDLSGTTTCVPFAFSKPFAPGTYRTIAVLDDNDNNLTTAGFLIDTGDLTDLNGTIAQVVDADVHLTVSLNYAYDQ